MFKSARLKLTFWYLLIIMLISFSFSVVIYQVIGHEIERVARAQQLRFERRFGFFDDLPFPPPQIDLEIIDESKRRLILTLAVVDTSILLISGVLGYFLAGLTLSPIQKMIDEQNRFISDSSHEFRTPLTSLKSAFEVNLRDRSLKLPQARNLIRESIVEVDKLQNLSDQLLTLAQYQKPNNHLPFHRVNLKTILSQALKKVSPIAQKKSIKIKSSLIDCHLQGYQENLTDLFVIILDNAIKYSRPNKEITVSIRKTDGRVEASIADQGIGISPKDLPHIFDRFFRADQARSNNNSSGYGLGLAIAKEIVARHQGSIGVKSQPGLGSIFTISFPL